MSKIPRLIHYCWFGDRSKPEQVEACICGWKEIMPDYGFIEWNENIFDVNINAYVQQAYQAKMFAFVSDYARLYAVYHHGGIYMDTDVRVIRRFDDLLDRDLVFGFELNQYVATSTFLATRNSVFIRDFMKSYDHRVFVNPDYSLDLTTNVKILTDLLASTGLARKNQQQCLIYKNLEKILVLEQKRFSPFDYNKNTYSTDSTTFVVHHYHSSWSSASFRLRTRLKDIAARIIGPQNLMKLRMLLSGIGSS